MATENRMPTHSSEKLIQELKHLYTNISRDFSIKKKEDGTISLYQCERLIAETSDLRKVCMAIRLTGYNPFHVTEDAFLRHLLRAFYSARNYLGKKFPFRDFDAFGPLFAQIVASTDAMCEEDTLPSALSVPVLFCSFSDVENEITYEVNWTDIIVWFLFRKQFQLTYHEMYMYCMDDHERKTELRHKIFSKVTLGDPSITFVRKDKFKILNQPDFSYSAKPVQEPDTESEILSFRELDGTFVLDI